MGKKKCKCPECVPGAPAWLATFGDLMSLLLCFFVLLLSMATLDKIKIVESLGSLKSALGVLEAGRNTEVSKQPIIVTAMIQDIEEIEMEETINAIKELAEVTGLQDELQVEKDMENEGVKVTLAEGLLFDRGSADLKPAAFPVLDRLAGIINNSKRKIRVEGHTDNVQVRSTYASNWELSTARGVNVVKYFVQGRNLDPRLFSAAGYGEFKPAVPNITEANRTKNRRVEVYFLGSDRKDADDVRQLRQLLDQ
ncbi:OmpA/MotB family protein [Chrysiogenes arsenatis]|uniref:OmpA/MotB family protein n=1 Tax=Chrysiogenes arsenatis TaxID=309797 RepID=UPI000408428E|nr:flagellar motor protein MotB [Chrysiogenes arsenatis]